MNLYAAAPPNQRSARLHSIFPDTILGETYDAENEIKTDMIKMLELGEDEQTSKGIMRYMLEYEKGGSRKYFEI
ncbi:hypothetical protein GQX73_g3552 [Xylaria multiplex]|uniref:Uncharacterized protein n=1 Tax=Xylaria multiplex TaxID=323545 RepID=A0A7C8IVD5_9PEZI|nr:hypothetical protein GQX73_g3552 [Xylaria multiplex]